MTQDTHTNPQAKDRKKASQKLYATKTPFHKTILLPLKGLRRTTAGAAVYQHIEILLEHNETRHTEVEEVYIQLLDILLKDFVLRTPEGSPLHVQLKLIMLHLSPPLSKPELRTLKNCLEACYEQETNQEITYDEEALRRILDDFWSEDDESILLPPQEKQTPVIYEDPAPLERRRVPRNESASDNTVDSAYKHHLHEKKNNIVDIQKSLAQQLNDTKQQNEELGLLLKKELHQLQKARSKQELDLSQKALVTGVEKLRIAHYRMSGQLNEAHQFLKRISASSQELNDELDRVHLLSLTDELTDLPNRRSFMRRLEDEVGRVQRYGNGLPLILIDLDGFKRINDQYGHAAGDKILRLYAKNILSIFRHHDMVARYGGEEFAVLLPNTDAEGALSAVSKVQRQAAKLSIEHNGTVISVPTFSAGIAHYLPGETPTEIIERADSALYRAKHLGRNRIELASQEK